MHIKNIKVNLKEDKNKICSFLTSKEKMWNSINRIYSKKGTKEKQETGKRTNKKWNIMWET